MANTTPLQYQREAVKIFDEVGLIKTFLKDPLRNHLLRLIVKDENILSKPPVTFINIPGIVVEKIAFATKIQSQPIPPSGNIGHVWQSDIEITLVCPENVKVTYPSGTALNGAGEVLNALYWVIYSMFSDRENKTYYSATDTTFGWDENAPIDIHYLNGGYMGVPDLWAIVLTFRFQFEGER